MDARQHVILLQCGGKFRKDSAECCGVRFDVPRLMSHGGIECGACQEPFFLHVAGEECHQGGTLWMVKTQDEHLRPSADRDGKA